MPNQQAFANIDLERYLLHHRCMHRMLEARMLQRVHRGQLPLLAAIKMGDAHSQTELATMLHISPASIAVSLRRLEASGFVRRIPVLGNLRANRVELTEEGEKAAAHAREIILYTTERMLSGFSQEEYEQLLLFQTKMCENLKQLHQEVQKTEESD